MAPAELFALDRDHFFELKNHLEMLATRSGFAYRPQLREMRELLRGRSEMVAMHSQPTALQQEVLRWIFRNEDKVWRDRGGRPGTA